MRSSGTPDGKRRAIELSDRELWCRGVPSPAKGGRRWELLHYHRCGIPGWTPEADLPGIAYLADHQPWALLLNHLFDATVARRARYRSGRCREGSVG